MAAPKPTSRRRISKPATKFLQRKPVQSSPRFFLNQNFPHTLELLKVITSILIEVDAQEKVTYWNQFAEQSFGLEASEVLGKRLKQCPLTWEAQRVCEAIGQSQKQGKRIRLDDVIFKRKDGKKGYLGFTVIPLLKSPGKKYLGTLLFGADISGRREAEENLRLRTRELHEAHEKLGREKVQLEVLLESIGEGMIATDPHAKILMMNAAAQEMTGFKEENVIGHIFSQVMLLEDQQEMALLENQTPLALSLAEKKRVTSVVFLTRQDKTKFPAAITVSPIIYGHEMMGTVQIFRDITKEVQVNKLKSEFISTASHELRTPLTGIREGIAQVLEGILGPVNERQERFLNISLNELDRLTSIVNDLLNISKMEAGKVELRKEWFDLPKVVEDLILGYQGLMKSKDIQMQSRMPSGEVRLYADREKITQIITNLISNAFKFTPPQGQIVISAELLGQGVLIAVSDTGPGISQQDRIRVFERFVKLRKEEEPMLKGAGLGLAICKNLVEMHHGRIWVESGVEKGTQVKLMIPSTSENLKGEPLIDVTTQLYGLHGFLALAEQQLKLAKRNGREAILFRIDLANMEKIEKDFGLAAKEQSLLDVANMLRETVRSSDVVSRLDGKKFCILAVEVVHGWKNQLLDRLKKKILDYNRYAKLYPLDIRIGAADYQPSSSTSLDELLERAGKSMGRLIE